MSDQQTHAPVLHGNGQTRYEPFAAPAPARWLRRRLQSR